MILNLTIENLLKSGCNEAEANELFNTITDYKLLSNNGVFFVSKSENMVYTGIDFYRKEYFENGNISFPYNCPDLVNEYFDLALAEFYKKQNTILGLLYNEESQFNNFKLNEILRSQNRINSQKDFISKMKHYKFENKENDILVCESYIDYLTNKKYLQPQQIETLKSNVSDLMQGTNQKATDFFHYLFDKYRPNENKSVVFCNIWHFLKYDADKNNFTFKTTQANYKEIVLSKYSKKIKKFAKNDLYTEDEKPILRSLETAFLKTLTP